MQNEPDTPQNTGLRELIELYEGLKDVPDALLNEVGGRNLWKKLFKAFVADKRFKGHY